MAGLGAVNFFRSTVEMAEKGSSSRLLLGRADVMSRRAKRTSSRRFLERMRSRHIAVVFWAPFGEAIDDSQPDKKIT